MDAAAKDNSGAGFGLIELLILLVLVVAALYLLKGNYAKKNTGLDISRPDIIIKDIRKQLQDAKDNKSLNGIE